MRWGTRRGASLSMVRRRRECAGSRGYRRTIYAVRTTGGPLANGSSCGAGPARVTPASPNGAGAACSAMAASTTGVPLTAATAAGAEQAPTQVQA